ncbi:MAG: AMP-binding protein, partial [Candidatus Omnitrophota bacterium]
MNVRETLVKRMKSFPSKPALIFQEQKITFSDLKETTFKLANALSHLGVKKGDKIAIYLPNCPEYVYSYLACFSLGCVGVPLDYMLKADELISCLHHSETKVLIAMPKEEVSLKQIVEAVPSIEAVILCKGQGEGKELAYDDLMAKASEQLPDVAINDSDPALIMYTSGTTGKPKGILLNYKHLEGSPCAMNHFVDLSENDIKLSALPLSHIAGLIYIQNCILFGITLVVMERFNPFEFLKNIEQYQVTCFHIVPAMYTAILTLK